MNMSFPMKTKKSLAEDTISNKSTKSVELNKCNQSEPSTSYEVFRNDTTAVEVIVKEVMNKSKKKILVEPNAGLQTIKRLREENETLQYQLANSNSILVKNRGAYRLIILEMKKQLDVVNRLELERQKENMALLLENEKLKACLDLKTKLVTKFKRELMTMRRALKLVIKNITVAPQFNENVVLSSDPEFDDFEKDLKKDFTEKFLPNVFDGIGMTFDSTLSKDTKDSFDKRF